MKKLQQIYDQLMTIDKVNKAKVLSWAEDIKPMFKATELDDGFVITYKANFLIQAIEQNNQVLERITIFLSNHDRYDSEAVFNTDVLNNGKIDLQFEVMLEEQADFVPDEQGDWLIGGINHSLVYQGFDFSQDVIVEFDGALYGELQQN